MTFTFEGEGSLKTTNQNNIGVGESGSGAASLTLRRAEGATGTLVLNLSPIYVGYNANSADGNSLTVTGEGLLVDMTGQASGQLIVGAAKANNSVTISDGAQIKVKTGNIAQGNSVIGNSIVVTGAGSLLTTLGNFNIGSSREGQTYETGRNNNQIHVTAGGAFAFDGTSTNSTLQVGAIEGAHSNSILIDGEGSSLTTNQTLQIGDSNALNLGGNRIEIRDHGKLETSANLLIYGYQSDASQHDGVNRLLIDATSTLIQSAGALEVKQNALLRLQEGGVLSGTSININGGRFEAAGSGLMTTGVTEIGANGVFALGSQDATTPSVLSINSTVHFAASSRLELGIFDQGLSDRITFGEAGHFSIEEGAILCITLNGYEAQAGDSWNLFDGMTVGITGSFLQFDLPTLDPGLSWDTSWFNQENGWRVRVIPEPSTAWLTIIGFLAGGGRLVLGCRRK